MLGKEKIIETSYMINLGSLEEDFYTSILIQYSFICFFSPFFFLAGTTSYIINVLVVVLTVLAYTKVTTRPISRKIQNIGIWNQLFNIVGYLGIVYN